ncbi:MAG: response regulator [Prevotella sp.]|nr:response regulator [Prevotella sp.]
MKPNLIRCLLALIFNIVTIAAYAFPSDIEFQNLRSVSGLSNSQVNDIYRDSKGYLWFATQSGLNRFDGYNFKVFYFDNVKPNSLPNNYVDGIQEDREGYLWIHTSVGYCIYNPTTETFEKDPQPYFHQYGVYGYPDRLLIDEHKNFWISVPGKGFYFLDTKRRKAKLFATSKKNPQMVVSSFANRGNQTIVCFNTGLMLAIDVKTLQIVWRDSYLSMLHKNATEGFVTFIDKYGSYWVATNGVTSVYCSSQKKWYDSANVFLKSLGYHLPFTETLLVKDIIDDRGNGLWIATDHYGLLRLDHGTKQVNQYTYNRNIPTSVPNNTIQSLFLDKNGALWIGCYKNGISYYSPSQSRFRTIPVGDICTITEDRSGVLWCGTDDNGIMAYDPKTDVATNYSSAEIQLGSNVVVSSMTARDGSLWFGAFNGGLTHYQKGRWTSYRADGRSGLLNDNVWSLCELPDGRVAVGTLGAGLQILNPKNGTFTNYSVEKNKLGSNYINSIVVGKDGRLIIGHAVNYSVLDLKTGKVENFKGNRSGQPFLSPQINQIYEDSRGIIWMATASGMNAYDPKTDQLAILDWQVGITGAVGCSVIEDHFHNMWLVSDHGVARVVVQWNKTQWEFFTNSYNSLDGLQSRQFNYRAITLTHNGLIVVGGQDGLNIITPVKPVYVRNYARVLFSGLVLFDHPLSVGEEYDRHVVLKQSMDASRKLHLKYRENAFTIQLASSEVSMPEKSRFMYRMKGLSDKWYFTTENQNGVTFTNMSPGKYVLEARVVTRYGVISEETSQLNITIDPPFYLSVWAFLLYAGLVAAAIWYIRLVVKRRQRTQLQMQQIRMEAERAREIDEMKLTFFTNVSHELRTPLMLIISPLASMLQKETDSTKHRHLELIYRNAQRLLDMVTQILDFRKIDKNAEALHLMTGDIVGYIRNITNTVKALGGKNIKISFHSPLECLMMAFDADKVRKMVDNILSNAMKFTPEGGKIDVTVLVRNENGGSGSGEKYVDIRIADNGAGISDEDKPHVFERFYQANNHKNSPYGGTGVGLNLVQSFARLHDGDVTVADNMGGGTVFTITLPVRQDATLASLEQRGDAVHAFTTPSLTIGDTPETEDGESSKHDKAKYEVLLVDDSEDFIEFMTGELAERFKVRTANNGKEALDRIGEHRPDIILCDVMMPVMDGNELCRRVKENKETATIPFILLTARLAQEHQVEGLQSGADDYITKPFNLDMLYLRMENLIKWHHSVPQDTQGKLQPELKPLVITSLDEQLIMKATAYVDDNISDSSITVETMAQVLGMSRVQLYKKMLSITGSTPSEFMRQIRMRRAEQLLRESQYSVSEVAYKVGFNIPRYFTKYFKEMYGVNPSQYKNQSTNGEET